MEESVEMKKGDDCPHCPHPFDPHVVIGTDASDIMLGGIVICPVKDCDCYCTWTPDSVPKDVIREPDEEELAELRARFQKVIA